MQILDIISQTVGLQYNESKNNVTSAIDQIIKPSQMEVAPLHRSDQS